MTPKTFMLVIAGFLLSASSDAVAQGPADLGVPYLLDGRPVFGRIGYLSDSLKVLKIIDDRQMLVRAYWQHRTEKADGEPVTLHVPILLVLRGLSTADLEVGARPTIAGIFAVTTDYRTAEYFDPAPILESMDADQIMRPQGRKQGLRR